MSLLMRDNARFQRMVEYVGSREIDEFGFNDFINATGRFMDNQIGFWAQPLNLTAHAVGNVFRYEAKLKQKICKIFRELLHAIDHQ